MLFNNQDYHFNSESTGLSYFNYSLYKPTTTEDQLNVFLVRYLNYAKFLTKSYKNYREEFNSFADSRSFIANSDCLLKFFYSHRYDNIMNLLQKKIDLDLCKERANKRFFLESGKLLTERETKCIDAVIFCNYKKKPLISFYKDKIKVMLESCTCQYMLDFDIKKFSNFVLVGMYKNHNYTLNKALISNLPNIIC